MLRWSVGITCPVGELEWFPGALEEKLFAHSINGVRLY